MLTYFPVSNNLIKQCCQLRYTVWFYKVALYHHVICSSYGIFITAGSKENKRNAFLPEIWVFMDLHFKFNSTYSRQINIADDKERFFFCFFQEFVSTFG